MGGYHAGAPFPPPSCPTNRFTGGFLDDDHPAKRYKSEESWLDDELDIQKHRDFDWKPVISVGRKIVWIGALCYFVYKLITY